MRSENRHIALTLDNFAGHTISHQPKNILLVFFAPNLMAFVQPLDAGIIHCFKAHYRRSFWPSGTILEYIFLPTKSLLRACAIAGAA
jgi:hypothetical protein